MTRIAGTVVVAMAACAGADVLVLQNGDRLTGELVGLAGDRVMFETEYAGSLVVDREAVAHIETDDAFELVERNGSRRMAVLTEDEPLAPVAVIRRNRLRGLSLADSWQTHVDVSASAASGSRDEEDFRVLAESTLRRGRMEHQVRADVLGEEVDGERTGDLLDIDYGLKVSFGAGLVRRRQRAVLPGPPQGHRRTRGARWQRGAPAPRHVVRALVGGTRRQPGPGGAGRRRLHRSRGALGPGLRTLPVGEPPRTVPQPRRPGAGRVGARRVSIEASTGVRYHLGARWNANARVDVRHETEPPEDNPASDVTYAVGLGVRF